MAIPTITLYSGDAPIMGQSEGDFSLNAQTFILWQENLPAEMNAAIDAINLSLSAEKVAIGLYAGSTNQGANSIAIGSDAGYYNQSYQSVAVGVNAGKTSQSATSVAIGYSAGRYSQRETSIAIGGYSGEDSQSAGCVSLGFYSGNDNQELYAIAIGYDSGRITQGTKSVSLGYNAGKTNQGERCVAIGSDAGKTNQYDVSVCLGYLSSVTAANQVQLGGATTTTYAYGAVQDRSDIRDKADIRDTTLGLDFINALRPVDFKWDMREDYRQDTVDDNGNKIVDTRKLGEITHDGSKTRTRFHQGLIAQEVAEVIKDTGLEFGGLQDHSINGGDDVMSIGYEEFIAPLIKAVQELSNKVKELEK